MIQWARYLVIVLGSVLMGLVGFLGVSHYTKSSALAARNWTFKFILVIAGISALVGAGIAGIDMAMIAINTAAPVGASATVPSYVTVMTPDGEEIAIELSWDVLGQNPVESVVWGTVEIETTAQTEFWIKNAATVDVWLTYNTTNWLPPEGNESLTLRWDRVNLNDWAIINGDWSIVQDELQTSAGVREVILVREDPGFNYEASTNTRVITSSTPESQIIVRYVDSNNYYFVGLGAYGYTAAIGIKEGGFARMLASGGNPNYQDIVVGQTYDMKVRVAGSTITVYLDGQEMCMVDDSTFGFGAVGLSAYQSDVTYDDFVVVDAFDPTSVVFQDYFAGPVLPVSESEKVTMFLDVGTPSGWVDFSFDIVITAWDESPP